MQKLPFLQQSASEIVLHTPRDQTSPVVLASPHSGRSYSSEFLRLARVPLAELRRSEDCFVDELFVDSVADGSPFLQALFPRCLLDVNRSPTELDQRLFEGLLPHYIDGNSIRVRAGLGVIPRLASNGAEIYSRRLKIDVARQRLLTYYFPYHKILRAMLDNTREQFGHVMLLDCHSMPSLTGAVRLEQGPDIVLGNQYGRSSSSGVIDLVEDILRCSGYVVERNVPYAGAFVTRYYGRPESGYEVLQLEINRALYMNEQKFFRGPNFSKVRADMKTLVTKLSQAITLDQAAE
mgnify:FL=1